ncbi:copper-binding protein [Rubrivirga sp.]|uniref:copper-binding protein n=1 Tax=Rubrivirga sp. TaxID=1885344 RepID=UPI003C776F7E
MRVLLFGLLALAACADAPAPMESTLEVRALYIEPVYQGEAILVNHEPIPDRMPAMRMAMRLYTPALLDSLTEGSKVLLTLDSASLEVIGIEELPFETVLDLDPGDENGRGGIVLPTPE